jgi:hypothetical protein
MSKPVYGGFSLGLLTAAIGSAALIGSSDTRAQVGGALQYPPASVGEDAQPPSPALTVPQIVSSRRTELGVSGSSQPPAGYGSRAYPTTGIEPPFWLGPLPAPPSATAGH